MICPRCRSTKTKVIDSRTHIVSMKKRRRKCSVCSFRFNTIEKHQEDVDVYLENLMSLVDKSENAILKMESLSSKIRKDLYDIKVLFDVIRKDNLKVKNKKERCD